MTQGLDWAAVHHFRHITTACGIAEGGPHLGVEEWLRVLERQPAVRTAVLDLPNRGFRASESNDGDARVTRIRTVQEQLDPGTLGSVGRARLLVHGQSAPVLQAPIKRPARRRPLPFMAN